MSLAGWIGVGTAALALVAAVLTVALRRRARESLLAVYKDLRVRTNRFKLTSKTRIREDLLKDDAVLAAIVAHAKETGCLLAEAEAKVKGYLEEIIPNFSLFTYYRIGLPVANVLLHLLYKIAIFREKLPDTKRLHRENACLYVFNHRSNADYVLAAYALHDRVALAFAVGEWARVWPLEPLFKAFGSYFIRRGFREKLYHEVLRRYVQLMTSRGVPQAVFLEGRLSRDGLMAPPKIGILDHIIQCAKDPDFGRDIVFIPGAINFDHALEDRSLVLEAAGVKEPPKTRVALRRLRKFGYATVAFGEPISLRAHLEKEGRDILDLPREERLEAIDRFARFLMAKIAALMPIPAVPLVALAFVRGGFSGDKHDLIARAEEILRQALARGHPVVRGDKSAEEIVEYGLSLLIKRAAITRDADGVYRVPEAERPIVLYYANSIAHAAPEDVPSPVEHDIA